MRDIIKERKVALNARVFGDEHLFYTKAVAETCRLWATKRVFKVTINPASDQGTRLEKKEGKKKEKKKTARGQKQTITITVSHNVLRSIVIYKPILRRFQEVPLANKASNIGE